MREIPSENVKTATVTKEYQGISKPYLEIATSFPEVCPVCPYFSKYQEKPCSPLQGQCPQARRAFLRAPGNVVSARSHEISLYLCFVYLQAKERVNIQETGQEVKHFLLFYVHEDEVFYCLAKKNWTFQIFWLELEISIPNRHNKRNTGRRWTRKVNCKNHAFEIARHCFHAYVEKLSKCHSRIQFPFYYVC